jgi:hypothetical protein
VGALYRSNFGASAQLGVHLTPLLTLGYAHDFSTNDYATSLGMSNEFILTYRFGDNKRNDRIEAEIKRLKDKQRQADQNGEKLLNEKFEEFKEELEAANKKQLAKRRAREGDGPQASRGRRPRWWSSRRSGKRWICLGRSRDLWNGDFGRSRNEQH